MGSTTGGRVIRSNCARRFGVEPRRLPSPKASRPSISNMFCGLRLTLPKRSKTPATDESKGSGSVEADATPYYSCVVAVAEAHEDGEEAICILGAHGGVSRPRQHCLCSYAQVDGAELWLISQPGSPKPLQRAGLWSRRSAVAIGGLLLHLAQRLFVRPNPARTRGGRNRGRQVRAPADPRFTNVKLRGQM